jgi:hypothetical protein
MTPSLQRLLDVAELFIGLSFLCFGHVVIGLILIVFSFYLDEFKGEFK